MVLGVLYIMPVLSVWVMYALPVPEELDEYCSYSVFKNVCIIPQCLMDVSILASVDGTPQVGCKNKMAIFLRTA
jgi:hypothetical protein